MSSIAWDNFLKPNFKTEFFLRNIRSFDPDTKYNYEEFLDNPKSYSMVFADTYDSNYIDDNIDIDAITLINMREQQSIINNIDANLEQQFNDQMVSNDDEYYTDDEYEEEYEE
jgi:hypothetical protein